MAVVRAGAVCYRGVRVCADWIRHGVRRNRKCVRVQSGRRLGAPVHHQRTRLRRTPLFTRCDGLVHARHHSRGSGCVRWLADFPHSASRRLAQAHIRRNPSADSLAACNSVRICALYFSIEMARPDFCVACSRVHSDGSHRDGGSSPAWLAGNRVRLAIAALAAIACPAIIHRAIFASLFTHGLVRRQRSRANHGRENGTNNFGALLHTKLNFPQL